jgi:small GTP-binding protein
MAKKGKGSTKGTGKDEELMFTVVCFGGSNVGISSFIKRIAVDFEPESNWGLGLEFYMEKVQVDGKKVTLVMFEVGKEESFEHIAINVKKGRAGVMLVFDVTRRETLDEILGIEEHLKKYLGGIPTILVANKADLKKERVVGPIEGKKVAARLGAVFIETSVVDRYNVDETFKLMAQMIMKG